MPNSQIMVNVFRGPLIESIHRGHIVVVNHNGNLLYSLGEPFYQTFARSTAKLLQAVPVIESGAVDQYHFSDEEIVLLCSSHNGEPAQVELAQSMLSKLALDEHALQCGIHEPYHEESSQKLRQQQRPPQSLHNTCSGKHAGMLALARFLQTSVDDYREMFHPVQQRMLQIICDMSGLSPTQIIVGTDGCGVPVFGMPIDKLALAFAIFGQSSSLPDARRKACQRILAAIRTHPYYLAGSGRFDTRLIEVTNGRIIGKMGAEGLFALTLPEQGWGMVVKVVDGSERALYPAVVEALVQLKLLNEEETSQLNEFHYPQLINWQGISIGKISPAFQLRRW